MSKFRMVDPEPNAAAYPTFETDPKEEGGEKPIAYVLVGLPGSGKSSWAANHPKKLPIASTDAYIEKIAAKKKISYEQAFKENFDAAIEDIKKQVDKLTKKPKEFIWDQVNLKREERMQIHKRLEPTHRVVYVVFKVPLSECLRRHESRERDGGRVVDAARIQKLAQETVFPEAGKEPFFKAIALTHPDWGKKP